MWPSTAQEPFLQQVLLKPEAASQQCGVLSRACTCVPGVMRCAVQCPNPADPARGMIETCLLLAADLPEPDQLSALVQQAVRTAQEELSARQAELNVAKQNLSSKGAVLSETQSQLSSKEKELQQAQMQLSTQLRAVVNEVTATSGLPLQAKVTILGGTSVDFG